MLYLWISCTIIFTEYSHKRITVLFEKLTWESKNKLEEIFEPRLENLSAVEANKILVRSSPIRQDNSQIQYSRKKT